MTERPSNITATEAEASEREWVSRLSAARSKLIAPMVAKVFDILLKKGKIDDHEN